MLPTSLRILVAVFLCSAALGETSPLGGTWNGEWRRDGDRLRVTFHFQLEQDRWLGSFDSDRLRVIGVPLRDIRVAGNVVEWKIVGDATTTQFRGELHGTKLSGTFDDNGANGTFEFERAAVPLPAVQEREVSFRNGDVVLAGSLLLPRGSEQKLPAVVFLHGSGAEGRWASKYLATRFANAGFAAFIYDKRGVGKSTGDWKAAKLDELIGDAVAAVATLRAVKEIDAIRIGLHGHSQGGTLAPLIAIKAAPVAFIIGSAAAGVSPEEAEIYSIEQSRKVEQLPAEEAALAREYIRTLVTTAYRGLPHERLLELSQQYKSKPWWIAPPAEGSYYWTFSPQFAAYEPMQYWRQVKAPVLLVYGADDQRVPPQASAAAIAQALIAGGAESITVRIFPKADHTLRIKPDGVWPRTPAGYPDELIAWATRQ